MNVTLLMLESDDVEGRKTIFVTKKIPNDSTRLFLPLFVKQSIATIVSKKVLFIVRK